MAQMQHRIVPHPWFDTQAREAAEFHVSVFPGSRITGQRVLEGTPSGTVETISFERSGQPFDGVDG